MGETKKEEKAMKNKFLVGLIGLFILGTVKMGEAVPMYYTFEGAISSTFADPGWNGPGSFPSEWDDLKMYQPISFTYLIDLETFDINDPSTYNVELTDWNDHFFVITGMTDEVISSKIVRSGYYGHEDLTYVSSESQYNWTRLGYVYGFDRWELGDGMIMGTSFDTRAYLGYDWSASLTNIAVPEPEPTTLLLFSFGLGVAGFSRRFRKS